MQLGIQKIMLVLIGLGISSVTQSSFASQRHVSAKDASAAIDAVRSYVGSGSKKFRIYDTAEGKDVVLMLTKIHSQDFRPVATNQVAVCTEFLSQEGRDYMLWIVAQKGYTTTEYINGGIGEVPYPNRTKVADVIIHKSDNIERVEWIENEDGIWSVRPVESFKNSHAEHQHEFHEAAKNLEQKEDVVCPKCGGQTAVKKKSKTGTMKHNCPSCEKDYDFVPYWYYHGVLPFEGVHVCETCDALVELCPVCLKKK